MDTEEISAFFGLAALSRSSSNRLVLIENQALYDDVCKVLDLERNHGFSCMELSKEIASACGFIVYGSSSHDGSAIHHPTLQEAFDAANNERHNRSVTKVYEKEISAVLAQRKNTVEIIFQKTAMRLPYASVYLCPKHEIDSICEHIRIVMHPSRNIREIREGL